MNSKFNYNPFLIIYQLLIFLPFAILTTIICAIAAIIISTINVDHRASYYPGKIWARTLCALSLVKIKVSGGENFIPENSYIFVSNHQSIFDIFIIYGWLNSKFKWIMKQEIRNFPFIGRACKSLGHIFIDRSNPRLAQKSINIAKEKLSNGNSVVLFPEGTRTKDGGVKKFKKGAFTIAKDIHLPIVPITIKGAFEVMPSGRYYIQPGVIEMIIHQPIETIDMTDANINEYRNAVESIIKEALL